MNMSLNKRYYQQDTMGLCSKHRSACADETKLDMAKRFSDAASRYDQHARIQQEVAGYAIERFASLHTQSVHSVLDIGCGTAINAMHISEHAQHYIGLDISSGMLSLAKKNTSNAVSLAASKKHATFSFVQSDAESLALNAHSIDSAYSSMALQWCNHPERVLKELHRVLKPNAHALLAIMVDGSFRELTNAWQSMGKPSRVNSFLPASAWQAAATLHGFKQHCHHHTFYQNAESSLAMLKSLKQIGAHTATSPSTASAISKDELQKIDNWLLANNQNGLALSYQVLFLELKK